jgi:hypothetical protein
VDVYLDNLRVIRTGGVFKLSGAPTAEFERDGKHHVMQLSWMSRTTIRYQLCVDGQSVLESRVLFPRNWPLLFLPALAIYLLMTAVEYLMHTAY